MSSSSVVHTSMFLATVNLLRSHQSADEAPKIVKLQLLFSILHTNFTTNIFNVYESVYSKTRPFLMDPSHTVGLQLQLVQQGKAQDGVRH